MDGWLFSPTSVRLERASCVIKTEVARGPSAARVQASRARPTGPTACCRRIHRSTYEEPPNAKSGPPRPAPRRPATSLSRSHRPRTPALSRPLGPLGNLPRRSPLRPSTGRSVPRSLTTRPPRRGGWVVSDEERSEERGTDRPNLSGGTRNWRRTPFTTYALPPISRWRSDDKALATARERIVRIDTFPVGVGTRSRAMSLLPAT